MLGKEKGANRWPEEAVHYNRTGARSKHAAAFGSQSLLITWLHVDADHARRNAGQFRSLQVVNNRLHLKTAWRR